MWAATCVNCSDWRSNFARSTRAVVAFGTIFFLGLLRITRNVNFNYKNRDFIENDMLDFAKKNPGVVVYLQPKRHRVPKLHAEYCKILKYKQVIFYVLNIGTAFNWNSKKKILIYNCWPSVSSKSSWKQSSLIFGLWSSTYSSKSRTTIFTSVLTIKNKNRGNRIVFG